jgi:hypothetical protein
MLLAAPVIRRRLNDVSAYGAYSRTVHAYSGLCPVSPAKRTYESPYKLLWRPVFEEFNTKGPKIFLPSYIIKVPFKFTP